MSPIQRLPLPHFPTMENDVPKTTNKLASRLKRLAFNYAQAYMDLSWIGIHLANEHEEIKKNHREARRKLLTEIDRVVSLVPTERHEEEG